MDIYVILIILTLLICGVSIYSVLQLFWKKVNYKMRLIASVLNTKMEKGFLGLQTTIKGYYKGRGIFFSYYVFDGLIHGTATDVSITPNIVPKQQRKFLLVDYPKPTKDTSLSGKGIRYRKYMVDLSSEKWTEQVAIEAFEELTRAAEIVESDSPYYKEGR